MIGDYCAVACAELFRGDGAILASPMGPIPKLGAQLAKATFEPELMLTDGVATLVDLEGRKVGWMPYQRVFDMVWSGRRHVLMGASQIDRCGNQNISCIGHYGKPKVMLLGARGAPGNTACHPTSYFIGRHSPRIFVPVVDMISGIGVDHGAFEIRRVVTNLGVFDFESGSMGIRSLHPGVELADVVEQTGFELYIPEDIPVTRGPTDAEREWLDRLDPDAVIRGAIR
jgi:acyl CoA:acetate/3-ketoacid CoA transferase beta subunit